MRSTKVAASKYVLALGTAVLLRATAADAARAVLSPGRYATIEVHRWQFGGRES